VPLDEVEESRASCRGSADGDALGVDKLATNQRTMMMFLT
jgi:hypothetical protein